MTYSEAIQFLYRLQLYGANLGLDRSRRLAELAGNPQDRLHFIHVAGSNGKGSVCAMLESIYRASGRRTGLFTSPHLVHFGERMQVNGQRPSEAEIVRLVERVKTILSEGAQRGWWDATERAQVSERCLGHPTFFEIVTVMALLHFAENGCEVVLWETGLGGRLDATNIVMPLASVITNVSLEHQQFLGDTTVKIAAEKSGIIKPGIPVVTATTDQAALGVLREVATSRNAVLHSLEPRKPLNDHQQESLVANTFPEGYQRANARLATRIVNTLQPVLPVSAAQLDTGLKSFHWPGRLQEFTREERRILVDGAHNPAGMQALGETLRSRSGWAPCPVIFGALADKDAKGVLKEVLPLASRIIFVPVQSERGATPENLIAQWARLPNHSTAQVKPSLEEAFRVTAGEPLTLVTGSLYLAGEAIASLAGSVSPAADEKPLNDWRLTTGHSTGMPSPGI